VVSNRVALAARRDNIAHKEAFRSVLCRIAILRASRRKFSAPGYPRLHRRPRASWNFCAPGFADLPLGAGDVGNAKSSTPFWPAIIVPRQISVIGIRSREAYQFVMLALVAGIHDFNFAQEEDVDGRNKP
jgi:hypothetical protein